MSTAPPGWHPDPTNPIGALRYWDGSVWTEHTHPHPASAAPFAGPPGTGAPAWANVAPAPGALGGPLAAYAPSASAAPPAMYATYATGLAGSDQRTFARKNAFSFVTIGFLLLYLVLAFAVHIVFLGILPVIMCIRAFRAKEPLAPAAAVAAVVAVGFALFALA